MFDAVDHEHAVWESSVHSTYGGPLATDIVYFSLHLLNDMMGHPEVNPRDPYDSYAATIDAAGVRHEAIIGAKIMKRYMDLCEKQLPVLEDLNGVKTPITARRRSRKRRM